MTSAFSWQNSVSLCPASFCTPRPNLPVTPGVSWLPTFAFLSPIMKRASFWSLVLEGLVGLHKTIQLQLLQYYYSVHRLGLSWHWMFFLGNKQRWFCHFWGCLVMSNSLRPHGHSLPGLSIHGIFQARTLEWVSIPFSRGSSQARAWTWVFCIAGRLFTFWITREGLKGIKS